MLQQYVNLNSPLTEKEQSLIGEQIECLKQAPIYLDNEELNADLLGETAEKFAKVNGIKAIFIDGLRNIFCTKHDTSDIEEIFQILKTTAIKLNIPIVVTDTCKIAGGKQDLSSQLYYPNFDHTSFDPVFDACDMMLVLHRPDYFGVNVDDKGRILRNNCRSSQWHYRKLHKIKGMASVSGSQLPVVLMPNPSF